MLAAGSFAAALLSGVLRRHLQVKQIAAARDGGRERMLAAVLRTLGGCSEDSASNASRVIAARGHLPSFQLLNSRLPTIRREAAFCVASLFQVGCQSPQVTH